MFNQSVKILIAGSLEEISARTCVTVMTLPFKIASLTRIQPLCFLGRGEIMTLYSRQRGNLIILKT